MIALEAPDILAVAARIVGCGSERIVEIADVDAVEDTVVEARLAGESGGVAVAAAALLGGLVRRRPFPGPNRRIAMAATLHLLAVNDWDLYLEPVEEIDRILDKVARGWKASKLTDQIRDRLRPRLPEVSAGQETAEVGGAWESEGGPFGSEWTEWPGQSGGTGWAELRESVEEKKGEAVFERFTDRARRVVVLAQEEARLLSHNYIGTEHLLLGLIHEGEGVAAKALESLDISLEAVRSQVREIIGHGQQAPSGHIPFTPRAKKVLDLGLREALQFGHNYIGTEHILLGLVREGEGVAAQVLVKLGADLGRTREQVIRTMSGSEGAPQVGTMPGGRRGLLLHEINALLDDNDRLRLDNERKATELTRVRDLLRRHGIDPDEELEPPVQ